MSMYCQKVYFALANLLKMGSFVKNKLCKPCLFASDSLASRTPNSTLLLPSYPSIYQFSAAPKAFIAIKGAGMFSRFLFLVPMC